MGTCTSRNKASSYTWEKDPSVLMHKMKQLQQDINVIIQGREEESEGYERRLMQLALKEAEWKKERKKLREEVKRLHRSLEEEEKIRLIEDEVDQIIVGKCGQFEGKSSVDSNCVTATSTTSVSLSLMELMKEERASRDETVVKWKTLYLAIKNELDELILNTHHQGTLYPRTYDKDMVEKMQSELKVKDEIIEILKSQIVSMENNEYTRKREVDILKQSLKIMSNKKRTTSATYVKRRSRGLIQLNKSLKN
ncbi:hypothetical protein vseg_001898 [Gypsophila vaccaria]